MPSKKAEEQTRILHEVAALLNTDPASVLSLLEVGRFPAPEDRLIDIDQVCLWLGVSDRAIYNWVKSGRFPAPIGLNNVSKNVPTKRWYIKEVREWLNGRPRGLG